MSRIKNDSDKKPAYLRTQEELDIEEGWLILYRFRTKADMAAFVNDPDKISDLEYRYPLHNYRRKLDIDKNYIAVLRR